MFFLLLVFYLFEMHKTYVIGDIHSGLRALKQVLDIVPKASDNNGLLIKSDKIYNVNPVSTIDATKLKTVCFRL